QVDEIRDTHARCPLRSNGDAETGVGFVGPRPEAQASSEAIIGNRSRGINGVRAIEEAAAPVGIPAGRHGVAPRNGLFWSTFERPGAGDRSGIEAMDTKPERPALLESALQKVVRQAPPGVDLFDLTLARGERARVFLDMVAFIEMARDS